MDIAEPRHAANNDDYVLECQEALDLPLADFVAKAIEAGWEPRAVYKAVEELARMQALAYEEDPDPAGE
jgi:hypothetical protein